MALAKTISSRFKTTTDISTSAQLQPKTLLKLSPAVYVPQKREETYLKTLDITGIKCYLNIKQRKRNLKEVVHVWHESVGIIITKTVVNEWIEIPSVVVSTHALYKCVQKENAGGSVPHTISEQQACSCNWM